MALDLPVGVELMEDVSPAAWVAESLWPWHSSPSQAEGPIRVGSFLPTVFAAYARILNPARCAPDDAGPTRWQELAESNGVELRPESTFEDVSGIDPRGQQALDSLDPLDGTLPEDETRALAALLAPFTTRPERCWFCLWVGQGYWWHGAHSIFVSGDERSKETRALLREYERRSRETDKFMRRASQVRTQHREYFLFRGPLRLADSFPPVEGPWFQSPNIWWPDDRAWCVATEVDGYSTYLGGSRECIDAALGSGEWKRSRCRPKTVRLRRFPDGRPDRR